MADLQRISAPVANLMSAPNGSLDRQMLFGDGFYVEEIENNWAKGYRADDNYRGYIRLDELAGWSQPTAQVRDLGAHVYSSPNIKTVPMLTLPFQALVTVVDEQGDFVELAGGGFVHQRQIEPIPYIQDDFTRTAERYLGVPYLWGGNSQWGIDCSGLVSAAMRSAGIACAGDSGEQEKTLGEALSDSDKLQRGDFIFWKGHVGIMFNETLLLHANGYHMKVAFEPLSEAEQRIAKTDGGSITARRRLSTLA